MTPRSSSDLPARTRTPAGNELTVVVAGARLAIGPAAAPPDQRADARGAGRDNVPRRSARAAMSVTFKIEGDKVTGFTLMPPQGSPVVYTRVEGK